MPLSIRYLIGAVIAGIWSCLSLGLIFTPMAPSGFITLGQYLLFKEFTSQIIETYPYHDIYLRITLTYLIPFCIYSILWVFIGALFASGIRKKIVIAVFLLIIYTIIGYIALNYVYIGIPGIS